MRWTVVILALVLLASGSLGAAPVENQGAETISLDGGSNGPVTFPHHRHQTVLHDCNLCHVLFPQQKGSIDKLKEEGQLLKKQVMNKLCISCHKERKQAGQSGGPVTCTQCHHRADKKG